MYSKKKDNKITLKKEHFLKICHDFRTPLSVIIGMTSLALIDLEEKEKLKKYLFNIETMTKYLLELVNDILDSSILKEGKSAISLKVFHLQHLLESLVTMIEPQIIAKEQKLEVKCIDVTEQYLIGDFLRLTRIFVNLLTNGVKYTPVKGSITMTVRQVLKEDQRVILEFKISDTGIGMSEEFMKRMFEPFEQEERNDILRDNTGLGLYITKNLVDLMSGTIQVESKLKIGTTITVRIPFDLPYPAFYNEITEEEKHIDENWEPEIFNFKGKRILIAEDNEHYLEIVTELLSRTGISIESAENGEKAVRLFEASPPAYYDGILMDVMMPVMNGLVATKKIRSSEHPDSTKIPILAMTANEFYEDVEEAREAGMNDYIVKPINFNRLFKKLEKFF